MWERFGNQAAKEIVFLLERNAELYDKGAIEQRLRMIY